MAAAAMGPPPNIIDLTNEEYEIDLTNEEGEPFPEELLGTYRIQSSPISFSRDRPELGFSSDEEEEPFPEEEDVTFDFPDRHLDMLRLPGTYRMQSSA